MYVDKLTEFASSLAVTNLNAGSSVISDVMDLDAAPTLRDLGVGEDMYLVIQVDTVFAGTTGFLVEFALQSDSTANLTTSPTTHYTTGALAVGALAAGAELCRVKLPQGNYERYLGIKVTASVQNQASGAYSAFLTNVAQRNISYPAAVTIG